MDLLLFQLFLFLFFGIPIGSVFFVIYSIIRFFSYKRKLRQTLDEKMQDGVRFWRHMMIVASVILGIVVILYTVFIILFARALAYM